MRKPKKPRPYYTLLAYDGSPGCQWAIEFGDYDLATVKEERDIYRDSGWEARHLKIITTTDLQADIEATVRELNEASK